jgi:hypothetical protein
MPIEIEILNPAGDLIQTLKQNMGS